MAELQVGATYRVRIDRPRNALLYEGDLVQVVTTKHTKTYVTFVSGKGRDCREVYRSRRVMNGLEFDWYVEAGDLEPVMQADAEPPASIDTFALLSRAERGGF